jgi:alpha-N-arabinofuranosidase
MKSFFNVAVLLIFSFVCTYAQSKETKIVIDASNLSTKINKNIYGQFSEHLGHCIYEGFWVGENSKIPNTKGIRNDVVAALKRAKIPLLRWPGGCFADEYHWKDGIGPRDKRPSMINTNWGGVTEDNSFGTHEFLELCSQIGCEPYFSGNLGSGTIQEFSQWVEYVNSDNVSPMTNLRKQNGREKSWEVKYWGIGNESWGCGGNMTAEHYADQLRQVGSFLKDYGSNKVFKIACGPNTDDYNWTEVLMKEAGGYFSGLSLHYYTWKSDKLATDVNEAEWFDVMKKAMRMEELISKHSAIMDKYDPNKKVGLMVDEWGNWFSVEPGTNPGFLYQQNTIRDAVTAATNLNIFNNHSDRVRMANIAQIINVLQALILTDKDKMVLTPTYYIFDMFKVHQDALLLKTKIESPDYVFGDQKLSAVNGSASIDSEGKIHLTLCNIDPKNSQSISCGFEKITANKISGQILTADVMNAHNSFDNPDVVKTKEFKDFSLVDKNLEVKLPPMSVVVLEMEGKYELNKTMQLKNPKPGINYKYYEGSWNTMPAFENLTPKQNGVMENFSFPKTPIEEYYGIQYDGYISIPADGLYTFYVNSDDGAFILIDGELVADNDGRHAAQEASGSKVLKAGYHEIKVPFFQASGGKVLIVSIEGPGLSKQIIPSTMLFQKNID